jgi:hypothetical protein
MKIWIQVAVIGWVAALGIPQTALSQGGVSGGTLSEKSYVYFFVPVSISGETFDRYVRVAKLSLRNAGKDAGLLRIYRDREDPRSLECIPTLFGNPTLARVNVVAKGGQEVACYTTTKTDWPSDAEVRDIVSEL